MNLFELAAVLTLDKSDYDKGLTSAEKEASGFGSKMKSALGTVSKAGTATLAAVSGIATATTKKLIDSSSEVAKLGDHIDKQSQKLGMSAQAYQEWDFILTHSGASVDSLQASMKTLSTQATKNADEFAALGISQEELQNSSPEELFEKVVRGLQGMEASTERTALASKLLGRSATELAPVLNASSEEIEGMRQQAHDLGKVLSDEAVKSGAAYEDSIYNLKTAMSGVKNQMTANFLPSLVDVMDGITGLISGDDSAIEKISEAIGSLSEKIGDAIPRIAETAMRILPTLTDAISKNVRPLVSGAIKLVTNMVKQMPQIIRPVINMLPSAIRDIAKAIVDNAPELIKGATDCVLAIVDSLPEILTALVEAAPDILTALVKGLSENIPTLIQGCIDLISDLVDNLPEIIAGLIDAIPDIIDAMFGDDGFLSLENIGKFVSGGIELVGKIVDKIPEIINELITKGIPNIIGSILNAFGMDTSNPESLGYKLKNLFGSVVSLAGGVFKELVTVAQTVFDDIVLIFQDPKKGLEKALDDMIAGFRKVFSSLEQIVTGGWELFQNWYESIGNKEKARQMEEYLEAWGRAHNKKYITKNGTTYLEDYDWEAADKAKQQREFAENNGGHTSGGTYFGSDDIVDPANTNIGKILNPELNRAKVGVDWEKQNQHDMEKYLLTDEEIDELAIAKAKGEYVEQGDAWKHQDTKESTKNVTNNTTVNVEVKGNVADSTKKFVDELTDQIVSKVQNATRMGKDG